MTEYAVVTGASTGLGKCIAMELAKRKINTLLTALPGENLSEVCEACRKEGTQSEYFEFDMTDKAALVDFAKTVNEKYDVFILVNNAGLGGKIAGDGRLPVGDRGLNSGGGDYGLIHPDGDDAITSKPCSRFCKFVLSTVL